MPSFALLNFSWIVESGPKYNRLCLSGRNSSPRNCQETRRWANFRLYWGVQRSRVFIFYVILSNVIVK
jgi:hypothetical protein